MAVAQKGMLKGDITLLKSWLSTPRKIVITTHQKPDADALGSSLALYLYLLKKGHQVQVISPTDYPEFLFWMAGNNEVLIYDDAKKVAFAEAVNEAEIAFCLDFNNLSRINELGELIEKSAAKKVLIDHHLEPDEFANFNYVDIKAAATCELLYILIEEMGDRALIDANIANCLYAGIMTDTGNFKHPNVTNRVFSICAQLIASGADTALVARNIYDSNSEDRLRLLGHSLKEKLVILPDLKAAYISLTAKELDLYHSKTGDTEGLVNYALSLKDVSVAGLFIERGDFVKMSFRSVGEISVNAMARKYFNGGGHMNAAGGQSNLTLAENVDLFIKALPEFI